MKPANEMLCSPSRNVCHSEGGLIRTSITLPSSRGFLTLNFLTYWGTKASLVAQLVRIHLQCRRPQFDSWVGKILWRRDRSPIPVFLGFPYGSAGKEFTCNVGDPSLIPGLERSPGEGIDYPFQYSWAFLMAQTVKNPSAMRQP